MNETQYIKRPAARADWLAARRGFVGGSDVAAILGLSPWKTPVQLYLDKTGRIVEDESEDLDATLKLRLGNALEQFAADEYTLRTGRETRNFGFMVARGHALADVDRLVVADGEKTASFHEQIRTSLILEIKTTTNGEMFADGIPDNYEAQVQQYMELTGCEECDVAVLILAPRVAFRIFRVQRDRKVGAGLVARIEKFWRECVETDTPPSAVSLADARALFPNARTDVVREATEEDVADVARLREIKAAKDALEAEEDEIKGRVAARLGECDTLKRDGVKLATFKAPRASMATDWKAVTAACKGVPQFDEAVAANTKPREASRRFLLCGGAK